MSSGAGANDVPATHASARVHIPSLTGTEWLNSEPLGPAELRGHVNLWRLTCINWLRQKPYVRAWSHAYRDDAEALGRLESLETA